ncbi:MAG: HlyD family efflux transporter periplasmic adaptor subunit [Symploca sp. SIO3C6]|nr:HlyD family efflux transporter periplasmic adaptor subunit [Symploca sp. SIO3C6]NET05869.1 HlyD family efflux transporter periplasmic adaptor subunit [Symploca sp. SIO2B6]
MNQTNGSSPNRQISLAPSSGVKPQAQTTTTNPNSNVAFDQAVILRQSRNWSHAILWTIVGVSTALVIWANIAEIDQAVPAQGKLEPKGNVNEVKAPAGGVVTEIHVESGDKVEKGDLLITLEPKVPQAQLASLSKVRAALIKENQFYRSQLRNAELSNLKDQEISDLELSREITSLTQNRAALLEENELYRSLLRGDSLGTSFNPQQRLRFEAARSELLSRVAAAEKEVEQLQEQFRQNQAQLETARSSLNVEQGILSEIAPLAAEGAVPRIQHLRQEQEVKTRQSDVEVRVLEEERLKLEIVKAQKQLENTIAISRKDLNDQIAANEIRIAEIDSQLNKVIVENEKQIADIDSQLSQANLSLSYQELRAPVSGTIFDLQPPSPGYVTNPNEPVLKIVPEDGLVARVYLTNKDIGFVEEGFSADVRIDSFPFSEFGDIEGKVLSIGSDALPPKPEENRPFYHFPAEISLKKESLVVNENRSIPLQSGMSVSVNIKTRKRSVMSIFTEQFMNTTESLKTVR